MAIFLSRSVRAPRTSTTEEVEDIDSQSGPAHSEIPLVPVPAFFNEDGTFVLGDRMDTKQTAAAWTEVSGHRYAVWAGQGVNGAAGLPGRGQDGGRRRRQDGPAAAISGGSRRSVNRSRCGRPG